MTQLVNRQEGAPDQSPCVGLALGGGGGKGLSQLGVLEVLTQNDVPIHRIAGTSIGAVVGGVFACGTNLPLMMRYIENFNYKEFLDFSVRRAGLIRGDAFQKLIATFTKNWTFDRAAIPFKAVATDLSTGEKVVLDRGPIHEAVRASISLPGVFAPHTLNGRILVDGGLVDNLPADVVRDMGADIVIAVDVGVRVLRERSLDRTLDVLLQTMDIINIRRNKEAVIDAEVLIRPDLSEFSTFNTDNVRECIQRGRDAANAAMPAILRALGRGEPAGDA